MTTAIDKLGKWPFCPKSLTPAIPEALLSLVIGGISEYLSAPVVLMEYKDSADASEQYTSNFIYPAILTAAGTRESMRTHRYPEFCKAFRNAFPGAEKICADDSACRGQAILNNGIRNSQVIHTRCHMGLNVYMGCITYLGNNLGVCTSGKFIQNGDDVIVAKRLHKYEPLLGTTKTLELLNLTRHDDCQRDIHVFEQNFRVEVTHLTEMVENYLDTIREKNEWACREEITQALYGLPNKLDVFSEKLEDILRTLQTVLSVEYLALFFADTSGDRVLPLTAQAGLPQDAISTVHFNWRKANLPNRDKFRLQEWLHENSATTDFPRNFLDRGTKGPGKEYLQNASHLIPYGREFRGVLIIGPWNQELPQVATDRGKDFIQSIGHLLVANALSKRAIAASLQHDRRRDFIVAMTAHSIKHSLHTFWNSLSRAKHYVAPNFKPEIIISSCEKMEEIIRTMSKNVEMSMSAPDTAVLPHLSTYEMEIERINLATLLYNCVGSLEDRARDKQIVFAISDNVDNLPVIYGDRYMLQLMLSNIIDNAIKYSRVGKQVRISAEREDAGIVAIKIEDYGWGIPKSDLEKIYEANYRSPEVANRKTQSRGIGLGLYQAQQFAHLHKGSISATSTPSGDSHIVRFTVRLHSAQQQESH